MTKVHQYKNRIETLKWEYVCADSSYKRKVAAAKLLSFALKDEVKFIFNKQSRNNVSSLSYGLDGMLLSQKTMQAWGEAKEQNDFAIVEKPFEELVTLVKQRAENRAEDLHLNSPYEAIIDAQTPGLRTYHIDKWSADLKSFCLPLWRQRIQKQYVSVDGIKDLLSSDTEQQKEMAEKILEKMGFDFSKGKIGESPHPLCFGSHDDVRIGMSYDNEDLTFAFLAAVHEGGHALYRQGLPEGNKTNTIAGAGMDEAIALLFENHFGKSMGGIKLLKEFNPAASNVPSNRLYHYINTVRNTPFRMEADEIRYPLDVILRYELEKEIFDKDLPVSDIPQRWKEKAREIASIYTRDDNEGALQDIHWYGGEFGWFPSYLFGTLAAAQLFETAKDGSNIWKQLNNGDLSGLKDWLKKNVFEVANEKQSLEIIKDVTGKDLDAASYRRHVNKRYWVFKDYHF
jgi:carboxypeptidase Taq